eukprot:TRINITY_DN9618_c0_g1_i1.p2 TRINITY_DN9618_c0_g1~~TRINITY_DN9618_c0_g1_i1.p2  ORF type:complete len:203 (+),score=30.88 TRINITY_DN9618_c0_g1_i1:726-1334(+)
MKQQNLQHINSKYTKFAELGILGEGETFGELEIIKNKKRQHSVQCISKFGKAFVISKIALINKIIFKKPSRIAFKLYVQQKQDYFDSFLINIAKLNKKAKKYSKDQEFQQILNLKDPNDLIKKIKEFFMETFDEQLKHHENQQEEKKERESNQYDKIIIVNIVSNRTVKNILIKSGKVKPSIDIFLIQIEQKFQVYSVSLKK